MGSSSDAAGNRAFRDEQADAYQARVGAALLEVGWGPVRIPESEREAA